VAPDLIDLSPPTRGVLPEVTTARLLLRRPRPGDLDPLAAVFEQEPVWHWPFRRGRTREETAAFLDRTNRHWDTLRYGLWLVVDAATARVVGYAGLSVPAFLPEILPAVEVGWRLEPAVWGRGYATEAATAALDEAFSTLGLTEVCSLPESGNLASVRVCERLGMRRDRVYSVAATPDRGPVDALQYLITAAEWQERRAPR
jgi:RimJ/RimL family protein N-acetyltransferase